MITVTRLDGSELVVNADLIATIEKTPDSVLTLVTGARYVLRESVDDIVEKVVAYRQRVVQATDGAPGFAASQERAP